MCQLFAASFNEKLNINYSFRGFRSRGEGNPHGWGLAWYPDSGVQIMKEPVKAGRSQLADFLQQYSKVRSKTFIGHVRRVSVGGINYRNTHPFSRENYGRDYSFAHNGTFGNLTLSAFYNPASTSSSSFVLQYADLIDGLTIGAGTGEVTTTQDEESVWVKYVVGNITLGWQRSEVDFAAAATADTEADHYGVSFQVNEDLAVSAGRQEVDFSTSGKADEESSGVSVSYTMGGLTIGGHANSTDNQDGNESEDETSKSINFAFAF